MLADIYTVMWKEWKEMYQGTSNASAVISLLMWAGISGIVFPLMTGTAWVSTPVPILFWSWLTLFLVSTMAAGSFAGERENHTLETLLASRLSYRTGRSCSARWPLAWHMACSISYWLWPPD